MSGAFLMHLVYLSVSLSFMNHVIESLMVCCANFMLTSCNVVPVTMTCCSSQCLVYLWCSAIRTLQDNQHNLLYLTACQCDWLCFFVCVPLIARNLVSLWLLWCIFRMRRPSPVFLWSQWWNCLAPFSWDQLVKLTRHLIVSCVF